MKACARCGREWTERETPGFRAECVGCGEPLHACLNCRFYEADARQWCREPRAHDTRPRDPESSNRCEWFQLGSGPAADKGNRAERAREGLANLFGETPPPPPDASDTRPDWMKSGPS